MNNMEEIWKYIPEYEGLYQVSNLGNIKSLEKSKGWCKIKEKTLKLRIDKDGYYRVILSKNSKPKMFLVHRLVAQAFIPNPNNLPEINHKNEIKTDNRVENLEWCTQLYNLHYGNRAKKISTSLGKPVIQYDLNMRKIMEYQSAQDASRKTGLNASHIGECCRKLKYHKTHGGYIWKYKGDE